MLCIDSPLGPLTISSDELGITGVTCRQLKTQSPTTWEEQCAEELGEFFRGERREFSVLLSPFGTAFQRLVWAELLKIPFGKHRSYGEIAARIGLPNAYRAVGNAVGQNPILILIPCHRVLPSDGSIGGFSAGVTKKRMLLELEKITPAYPEVLVA